MEKTRLSHGILIPSIADLFFASVLLAVFFSGTSGLLVDGDTGYHIRAGEQIVGTGSIPRFDTFSFHTPPLPWTAHEWLSEVLMASVHGRFGLDGVVAASALLLAATISVLFATLRKRGGSMLRAVAITLAVLLCSQIHWLARPHLFSLFFMVVFHYLVDSWQAGRSNRLYLLPPLMLLWVNLHGGYLGGFILAGAYLLGELIALYQLSAAKRSGQWRRIRELSFATLACLVACLFNPYGWKILLFPFRLVSDNYLMDNVAEFLSPDFHRFLPFKYLLLFVIGALALSRKRLQPSELVLVILFTNMALYSVRYIPLFALVTAPILNGWRFTVKKAQKGRLAQFLSERSERIEEMDAGSTGHLWSAAAVLAVTIALCCGGTARTFDEKTKPVAACEFLMRERIAGNMFNNDEFGDYLIYRCYPRYRVFIDGRLDMYGSPRLKEYNRVISFEPGWETTLAKYGITWMMIESQSKLARFLSKDPEWTLVYSDPVAAILVKRIPQHRHLVARYAALPKEGPKLP